MREEQASIRQQGKRGGKRSTSWKPGQSGNPKGRPPNPFPLTYIAAELGELKDRKGPKGEKIQRKRALVEKVYAKALDDGDLAAIRMLWDKLEALHESGFDDNPPQATEEEIWSAVMALMREVSDRHPEVRKDIIDILREARGNT
jgi:hypothetical protein